MNDLLWIDFCLKELMKDVQKYILVQYTISWFGIKVFYKTKRRSMKCFTTIKFKCTLYKTQKRDNNKWWQYCSRKGFTFLLKKRANSLKTCKVVRANKMPLVLKEFHYRLGKTVQTNATLTAFKGTILLFSLLKFLIKQRLI